MRRKIYPQFGPQRVRTPGREKQEMKNERKNGSSKGLLKKRRGAECWEEVLGGNWKIWKF